MFSARVSQVNMKPNLKQRQTSAGHGYLLPMGIVILAVGFAQGFAITGWGEYFPWAIAGLYAQGKELGLVSYAILLGTGVAGVVSTVCWWERADQTR